MGWNSVDGDPSIAATTTCLLVDVVVDWCSKAELLFVACLCALLGWSMVVANID